jgi:multiple sugar transport system substrate-binding protein
MKAVTTLVAAAATLLSAQVAQAQTTVTMWSFLDPAGNNARSKALKHVIDTFEAANPGTKVQTNVIQWTEISPTLLRAARSKQVPDVVMLYSPFLPMHIAAGTISPLDSYLNQMPKESREDLIILPSAQDKKGSIYGVPYELRVSGWFYRDDLMRERNLDLPDSMDEMVEVGKQFSKDGMVGIGLSFSPGRSHESIEWLVPALVGMGAKVLNEDGSAAFNSPQAVKLLNYLHDLVHKHKVLPLDVALSSSDDVQKMAETGKVAFFAEGTHRLNSVQNAATEGAEFKFMPFPSFEEGSTVPAAIQGWNLTIPRGAKNADAAWKFIAHWTSPEMQLHQTKAAGYLPVRESVAESSEFNSKETAHIPAVLKYAAKNPLKFTWPENSDVLADTWNRLIEQYLVGKMSAEEALVWGDKAYNDLRR